MQGTGSITCAVCHDKILQGQASFAKIVRSSVGLNFIDYVHKKNCYATIEEIQRKDYKRVILDTRQRITIH